GPVRLNRQDQIERDELVERALESRLSRWRALQRQDLERRRVVAQRLRDAGGRPCLEQHAITVLDQDDLAVCRGVDGEAWMPVQRLRARRRRHREGWGHGATALLRRRRAGYPGTPAA